MDSPTQSKHNIIAIPCLKKICIKLYKLTMSFTKFSIILGIWFVITVGYINLLSLNIYLAINKILMQGRFPIVFQISISHMNQKGGTKV